MALLVRLAFLTPVVFLSACAGIQSWDCHYDTQDSASLTCTYVGDFVPVSSPDPDLVREAAKGKLQPCQPPECGNTLEEDVDDDSYPY